MYLLKKIKKIKKYIYPFSQVDEIGPPTYTLITCQVLKDSKPIFVKEEKTRNPINHPRRSFRRALNRKWGCDLIGSQWDDILM
jgi:hypothetical protein